MNYLGSILRTFYFFILFMNTWSEVLERLKEAVVCRMVSGSESWHYWLPLQECWGLWSQISSSCVPAYHGPLVGRLCLGLRRHVLGCLVLRHLRNLNSWRIGPLWGHFALSFLVLWYRQSWDLHWKPLNVAWWGC